MNATMAPDQLLNALARIAGAEAVSPAHAETDGIDGVQPGAVVAPPDVETLAEVLRFAHRGGLAVMPRGGGSKMSIGNIPPRADIVLSTARLNRVLDHEPGDMTASVEAGCTLADLQRHLAREGQRLPLDPPHANATLGGILAANASGPRRALYGTARDHVIGVRFVRADGVIAKGGGRVVKNVAGYDLNKLMIGALGTLGVLVEVHVKVGPLPAQETPFTAGFRTAADAVQACRTLLARPLSPAMVEVLNPIAAVLLVPRAVSRETGWRVLWSAEGTGELRDRYAREFDAAASLQDPHEVTWFFNDVLDTLSERRARLWGDPERDLRIKVCVLPSRLEAALDLLAPLSQRTEAALVAHASCGVIHLLGFTAGERDRTALASMLAETAETVRGSGGHFVIESAPVEFKQCLDVWGPPGSDFGIMRAVKQAFDPRGILNPGRYVGGL